MFRSLECSFLTKVFNVFTNSFWNITKFPLWYLFCFYFSAADISFSLTQFSSVQSLSHVRLFGTPWTAASQTSLPITNSHSLLKLMSIWSVMPPNHLILCCPLLLPPSIIPESGSFQMSQLASGGQSIGVSASASVLPMNIQTDIL